MRGVESACLVRISSVIEDIDKFLGLWGDGVKCLELELNCRIPDDHMVACETGAGGCDATLSWPASAYCS